MLKRYSMVVGLTWCLTLMGRVGIAAEDPPKSVAEKTNYVETSRYDDVVGFLRKLEIETPLPRVLEFGKTGEGRGLPLWVLADPPIAQPREALTSGKPIVLVMANIHAGEVEGKEAAQNLARRLTIGDLKPLLAKVVVLIAPIYNADGNDKIDPKNRSQQNGPVAGVGLRENAQGLDLNRDFIKLDAPETKALVKLFNEWDPHLVVDLHTTNGSYHGYHLTYSIPLNPMTDQGIANYQREKMMPALARAMLGKHALRTYYYGNFERRPPRPGEEPLKAWYAFTHAPRIGQNYVGLRNRLAILSEAYSYLDFRRRVQATEAFVVEILTYTSEHASEIKSLTRGADLAAVRAGQSGDLTELGIAFEPKALAEPLEILVGEVTHTKNPRSGTEMTVMVEDKIKTERMLDFGAFAATKSVRRARGYFFANNEKTRSIINKLKLHGVLVEELTDRFETSFEVFTIESVERKPRAFQGHHEVGLKGTYRTEKLSFPSGTIVVRSAQPLGALAAYLLEPQSDDGLVTWNVLDPLLEGAITYPIVKLMEIKNMPLRELGTAQ